MLNLTEFSMGTRLALYPFEFVLAGLHVLFFDVVYDSLFDVRCFLVGYDTCWMNGL